jgi:hypothetical protein
VSNDPLTELGPGLPIAQRAQVQIIDLCINGDSEAITIVWLGRLEEGSEVHSETVNHFD